MGKTTLCVNLAYALARRGWSTLVVDTDPQSGIGLSLTRSSRAKAGFFDFIGGGVTFERVVLPSRLPELSILPAGQFDACARRGLPLHEMPTRLGDLLRSAELRGFDCLIFDTAAGLTGLTETVVKASDYVLVPQQAEPLAVRSLPHLLETLARFRGEGAAVKVAGILLTMVMNDEEMSLQVAREVRQLLPKDLLFKQSIPRLPSFLEASTAGVPVALLKRNPPPEAVLFEQIAAELEERIGLMRDRDTHHRHASLLD
ncbi:MAG: ParA family protein [Verrucomicrobiales bacterium]|nr:ParA family protein [Verrucomicrobiales bacterium]